MNDKTKKLLRVLTLVLVFVAVIAIDLATKYYICKITSTGERIYFIKGVLEFTYSENTGASFGIMGKNTTLLTVFSCISAALITAYLILAKKSHFLLQLSLTMFIGGAIGNIYDRIKFHYVRDFIEYTFTETLFNYQFAICNFADAVLVVACIMLIIYVLFFYSKQYDKNHPKQNEREAGQTLQNETETIDKFEQTEITEDSVPSDQIESESAISKTEIVEVTVANISNK